MLAPAHPDKNDPGYRDKKEQHRKDQEDMRRHPERWGFVRADHLLDRIAETEE